MAVSSSFLSCFERCLVFFPGSVSVPLDTPNVSCQGNNGASTEESFEKVLGDQRSLPVTVSSLGKEENSLDFNLDV